MQNKPSEKSIKNNGNAKQDYKERMPIGQVTKKEKHLTIEDRQEIQDCLHHGMTFKAIACRIGKDPTTVSKEVKKHMMITEAVKRPGFEPVPCPLLLRAPFVCNACQQKRTCRKEKHEYSAKAAHRSYRDTLAESRTGIALNKSSFYEADRILTEAIKNGQHLYHAIKAHELNLSISSAYRYVNRGYLSFCRIDLPRAVKFKPGKASSPPVIPKGLKQGRTYDCFLEHVAQSGITSWVEMDTVIGRIGDKVLLTFNFTFCNFMLGFLLDDKTAASVSAAALHIKNTLRLANIPFSDLFPVILTDNGTEFSDVFAFEKDENGQNESHLFFCDPYCSSQKPHVEKGHTLLRDILPKGSSFHELTQEKVNLIFSHMNSVIRNELRGKTPYEMFSFVFGATVAELFGIVPIAPKDVVQSPKLLK